MKLSLKVAIMSAGVLLAFPLLAALSLQDGEICFCNLSTNEIVVTEIFSDGTVHDCACGILVPDSHKTWSDERMFPLIVPQNFEIRYDDGKGVKHTNKFDGAWIKAKKAKEGTVYFVFTREQKFVLEVFLGTLEDSLRLHGLLLPEEDNPVFKSYKELLRASYDGDAPRVRELLAGGAPCQWPDEPVSMSPLQWSVRWNRKEVFDILIDRVPQDFSPYGYYNCIKLAAQDGREDMLRRLLQSDLAKDVPNPALQEIFYHACDHNKANPARTNEVETLQILLEHFKVGIDYQAGDYGHTLLFVAVMADDHELVTWLLGRGANPNAKLRNGLTTLNLSRSEGMRKLLIDHGAF